MSDVVLQTAFKYQYDKVITLATVIYKLLIVRMHLICVTEIIEFKTCATITFFVLF